MGRQPQQVRLPAGDVEHDPGLRAGEPAARVLKRPSRAASLLSLLALVLLGGCRADLTVAVRAGPDGGGDVSAVLSLDKEAAAQVEDLAEQLRVGDLRAAGWRIEGPAPAPGGRTELRAVKGFDSPAGAKQVIQELSGPSGPFGSLRLTRSRSFFKTRTALNGTVDLTAGLEAFSDQILRARLGGMPLGVDPSLLRSPDGGGTADGGFGFSVKARLPGTVEANAPDLLWRVRPGQRVAVSASAEQWNVPNIALGALSLIFGTALVVTMARWRRPGR